MSNNPTKILLYDLDDSLRSVFQQLEVIKGSFNTLNERFENIDVDMLAPEEQSVIQDLIDAWHNDGKGITRARLQEIEDKITNIQSSMVSLSLDGLEMGDYNETFVYDDNDNVVQHEVAGDRSFVVSYRYKEDNSGELIDSTKTFTDEEGNTIEIKKNYSYDTEGNITGIATTTTSTPPAPDNE